jgi:hypothetical protein
MTQTDSQNVTDDDDSADDDEDDDEGPDSGSTSQLNTAKQTSIVWAQIEKHPTNGSGTRFSTVFQLSQFV